MNESGLSGNIQLPSFEMTSRYRLNPYGDVWKWTALIEYPDECVAFKGERPYWDQNPDFCVAVVSLVLVLLYHTFINPDMFFPFLNPE